MGARFVDSFTEDHELWYYIELWTVFCGWIVGLTTRRENEARRTVPMWWYEMERGGWREQVMELVIGPIKAGLEDGTIPMVPDFELHVLSGTGKPMT